MNYNYPTLWDLYLEDKIQQLASFLSSSTLSTTYSFLDFLSIACSPGIVVEITGTPESGKSFLLSLISLFVATKAQVCVIGMIFIYFLLHCSLDTECGFPSPYLLSLTLGKYGNSFSALAIDDLFSRISIAESFDMNELYYSFVHYLKLLENAPGSMIVIDSITRPIKFSSNDTEGGNGGAKLGPKVYIYNDDGNEDLTPKNSTLQHLKALASLIKYASKECGHFVRIIFILFYLLLACLFNS